MTDVVQIFPVRGIGDVVPGDDLAELITANAPWLADGDILVVTSKIVSKAEGRLVEVPADGPEREAARAAVLAAETARVVARRGPTTIVQTHHGFVMAAAGIDASNVDKTHLVLLPADPDASARRLRAALRGRGLDVAVVVSDTAGRAWRNGLTDVALGAAGIEPFRDHRGETDPYGNELLITQMAVIDELAAAGELVKGKVDNVPVAVVRGLGLAPGSPGRSDGSGDPGGFDGSERSDDPDDPDDPGGSDRSGYPGGFDGSDRSGDPGGSDRSDGPGAAALLRDAASDMFSLGTAEARSAGLRDAARLPEHGELPGLPVDEEAVARALASVAEQVSPALVVSPAEPSPHAGAPAALHVGTRDTGPPALMRLGAELGGLAAGAVGQLGAGDAVGEAEVVLDPAALPGLPARGLPLDEHGAQPLGRAVDGGAQPGRAAADDHEVVELLPRVDGQARPGPSRTR